MSKKIGLTAKCACALAMILATASQAAAQTTDKDVQVGARAAAFVEPAPSGDIPTAIIFDPANASSKADADAIAAALGGGLAIKNGTLKGTLVPTASLSDLAKYKVAFVAQGLGAKQADIASVAAQNGVLTISTDMSCVESNNCVVGVASAPKVSIIVSRAAREDAGLGFGSAFLMMVKEQ